MALCGAGNSSAWPQEVLWLGAAEGSRNRGTCTAGWGWHSRNRMILQILGFWAFLASGERGRNRGDAPLLRPAASSQLPLLEAPSAIFLRCPVSGLLSSDPDPQNSAFCS
jgi:hypothetical protein